MARQERLAWPGERRRHILMRIVAMKHEPRFSAPADDEFEQDERPTRPAPPPPEHLRLLRFAASARARGGPTSPRADGRDPVVAHEQAAGRAEDRDEPLARGGSGGARRRHRSQEPRRSCGAGAAAVGRGRARAAGARGRGPANGRHPPACGRRARPARHPAHSRSPAAAPRAHPQAAPGDAEPGDGAEPHRTALHRRGVRGRPVRGGRGSRTPWRRRGSGGASRGVPGGHRTPGSARDGRPRGRRHRADRLGRLALAAREARSDLRGRAEAFAATAPAPTIGVEQLQRLLRAMLS